MTFKSSFFIIECVKHILHILKKELQRIVKNIIKPLRERQKISQRELAVMCDVSRQTINAIGNNKYDPSLQLAFDIAEHLNSRIDEVFINERKDEN